MKYAVVSSVVLLLFGVHPAQAQQTTPCRVLCTPEFKVEPTITFTNLCGSPRTIADDGAPTREPRETEFELILSLGLPTRITGWTSLSKRSSCRSMPSAHQSSSSRRIWCGFPHSRIVPGSKTADKAARRDGASGAALSNTYITTSFATRPSKVEG